MRKADVVKIRPRAASGPTRSSIDPPLTYALQIVKSIHTPNKIKRV